MFPAQATPTQTTPETTAISYNDKHEEEASAIDGVTWQSGITFDDKGRQVQEAILHNGISATLTFADENNTLTIEASNGENYVFDLDDLKEQAQELDTLLFGGLSVRNAEKRSR